MKMARSIKKIQIPRIGENISQMEMVGFPLAG